MYTGAVTDKVRDRVEVCGWKGITICKERRQGRCFCLQIKRVSSERHDKVSCWVLKMQWSCCPCVWVWVCVGPLDDVKVHFAQGSGLGGVSQQDPVSDGRFSGPLGPEPAVKSGSSLSHCSRPRPLTPTLTFTLTQEHRLFTTLISRSDRAWGQVTWLLCPTLVCVFQRFRQKAKGSWVRSRDRRSRGIKSCFKTLPWNDFLLERLNWIAQFKNPGVLSKSLYFLQCSLNVI